MRKIFILALCVFVLFSCQKNFIESTETPAGISTFPVTTECGTPVTKDLWDQAVIEDRGDMQIGNDADNIIIWYSAPGLQGGATVVKKLIAVYGSYNHVLSVMNETIQWTPCQGPVHPDRIKVSAAGLVQDSMHIPNSAFQSDGCVWMGLFVTLGNDGGFEWCTFPKPYDTIIPNISAWKVMVKYCKQSCGNEDCGQLRTQTQGGWGAKPSGNNPGTYLHANFAGAFPSGVKVGCDNGFTVKFTTAQAITDFLPAGGTPAKLKANATNPADKSIKNVLIGQLTALTLSVGFDKFDPDFGEAGKMLGDMLIKKGKFRGKTVNEFLKIANDVLGGCSHQYKPSDINETASKINENFVDGKKDKHFLVCHLKDCDKDDHDGDDDHDDDDHDDDHG